MRDGLLSQDGGKDFFFRVFPSLERISKRYPEIGDRPKKVLSNPPKSSIETHTKVLSKPLKRFYRNPKQVLSKPQKGSIEAPFWPSKRFYRAPAKGSQNCRKGSIEPFASNPPPSQVTLVKSTLEEGRARQIRGWGLDGLCLINPSQGYPLKLPYS